MAELEQIWKNLLDQASLSALEGSRHDVADYLRLKLANDAIRRAGVDWLFQTLIEHASEASKDIPHLRIDRISPHSFKIGASNMVGSLIQVTLGVRCLSLEAGWARTPSDGIMRNSALANARISHFGMPREVEEYKLIKGEPFPKWKNALGEDVRTDHLEQHLQILLRP